MKRRLGAVLGVLAIATALTVAACAAPSNQSSGGQGNAKTTEAGNPVLDNEQLSSIAPGLGTVMVEAGYRNWVLYYAGNGGNWGLAAYQAKEIGEIFEVGETTRPKRKGLLEDFRTTALKQLTDAINAGDKAAFQQAWTNEVQACNDCHSQTNFSYIVWKLPPNPPNLDVTIQSQSPSATAAATSTPGGSNTSSTTP